MDKTEEHRKIYPLPFEQISKLSSFEQIFGKSIDDYTEDERKERWAKATSFKGGKDVKEYYENSEGCEGCRHFQNGWCALASLPCGINPVLTFRMGMVGMACQGVGYEAKEGSQIEMEFDKSDLPF